VDARSLVNARRPCEWPAVVAHLSDKPGVLELNAEDDVTRSAAVIQAASYQLVPLSRPIGPWAILAVSGHGLLLVSVARDAWPTTLGSVWAHPAGWPVYTRRLVHRWVTGADLTEALPLG
jgi:hypothetical protein